MAILTKTLKTLAAGTAITGVFIYQRTKHSTFIPLQADDKIFALPEWKRNNPHGNVAMQDLCVRRVPMGKVKFELLKGLVEWEERQGMVVKKEEGESKEVVEEDKVEGKKGWGFWGKEKVEEAVEKVAAVVENKKGGKHTGEEYALVEAFCAGIWSGLGYQPQRAILARKYQHLPDRTATPNQLWSRKELATSTYPVGTHITDHFEVVSKTPTSITVRCGDSPLANGGGLRDSDGLFEIGVKVIPAEGFGGAWGAGRAAEVEFSLKSVFYKGATKAEGPPMPVWMEYAHKLYTKIWMETAIFKVMN